MKPERTFIAGLAILLLSGGLIQAQSNFDPAVYKQFIETNKTLTASQLLENNPPKTRYYSSRTHPAELKKIPWFDSINQVFSLTETEQQLLSKNFFVVPQRLEHRSWVDAFVNIYNNDLPVFISSDFVLFTLHNSYDAILQSVEWQYLEPNLIDLLNAMNEAFLPLYNKYSPDERLSDALADVELYLSVARSLLLDESLTPQMSDASKYTEIMAGIESEQLLETTLFTETRDRKIDFSQFKPRGHYNKIIYTLEGEKTLENYFRTMMWLGRIDFLLTAPPENPWEPDWTDDELRRMQLGALLLNELLHSCTKKQNLDNHERIISYLVGPDDNMTPGELKELADLKLDSPVDIFSEDVFDDFMASLNASDDYGQKIMSNFFYVDPFSEDPGNLPVSYKLLGQKFLIDSYIFSEVVFDRIVHDGVKIFRGLPDPLDAMAVLGNEDAMALLKTELEEYKYAYKISSLKYLVDAYDDNFWEESLYNTWLAAIRELNPPSSSEKIPYFMQTTAWHHEKLNTQLTSWAELRHDNLLYGKQSYTGGTACSYPYSYVEPYPEFYDRLALFAENASSFFSDVFADEDFYLKTRIIQYYNRYAEIMEILKGIAEKELSQTALNESEITFLKTMINSYMVSGPMVDGWFTEMFFDIDKGLESDFVVADVHTQPTDYAGNRVGHVLHVGNGMINTGVFLVSNPCDPDRYTAFAGPLSSFHYDVTRDFNRHTDQEWKEKFTNGDSPPARPDWVAHYMSGKEGSVLPEGRNLKGEIYTGTGILQESEPRSLDYFLVFPNPASRELHLRFILNYEQEVTVEVYDVAGRMINSLIGQGFMPGEHDIPIIVKDWERGVYILKVRAGMDLVTRKVILN